MGVMAIKTVIRIPITNVYSIKVWPLRSLKNMRYPFSLLSQLRHPEPCEATAKDLISTRFFDPAFLGRSHFRGSRNRPFWDGPLGLRMTKLISCLQRAYRRDYAVQIGHA